MNTKSNYNFKHNRYNSLSTSQLLKDSQDIIEKSSSKNSNNINNIKNKIHNKSISFNSYGSSKNYTDIANEFNKDKNINSQHGNLNKVSTNNYLENNNIRSNPNKKDSINFILIENKPLKLLY